MTKDTQFPPSYRGGSPPRRTVVLLGLASLFGGVIRMEVPGPKALETDAPALELLVTLPKLSASIVGKAVQIALPDIGDRRRLVDELLVDLGLNRVSVLDTPRAAMALKIAQRIRDDFKSGRMVNVAGWRLALTEARLCALADLHFNRAG